MFQLEKCNCFGDLISSFEMVGPKLQVWLLQITVFDVFFQNKSYVFVEDVLLSVATFADSPSYRVLRLSYPYARIFLVENIIFLNAVWKLDTFTMVCEAHDSQRQKISSEILCSLLIQDNSHWSFALAILRLYSFVGSNADLAHSPNSLRLTEGFYLTLRSTHVLFSLGDFKA